jgi:hypothetical protein
MKGKQTFVMERNAFPSVHSIAGEMGRRGYQKSGYRTVHRVLKASGFKSLVIKPAPEKSKECHTARCKFVNSRLPRPKFIRFTDEKRFTLGEHGMKRQWIGPKSKRRTMRCIQQGVSVWVFGIIGCGVKKLVILPEFGTHPDGRRRGFDSEWYIKHCLKPHLKVLQAKDMYLMEDGAKAHTCKATREWVKQKKIKCLPSWPAHSPDMNPIENLWSEMDRKVQNEFPTDRASLIAAIQKVWDETVDQAKVDRYVLSFTKKTEKVKAAYGKRG